MTLTVNETLEWFSFIFFKEKEVCIYIVFDLAVSSEVYLTGGIHPSEYNYGPNLRHCKENLNPKNIIIEDASYSGSRKM